MRGRASGSAIVLVPGAFLSVAFLVVDVLPHAAARAAPDRAAAAAAAAASSVAVSHAGRGRFRVHFRALSSSAAGALAASISAVGCHSSFLAFFCVCLSLFAFDCDGSKFNSVDAMRNALESFCIAVEKAFRSDGPTSATT